MKLSLRVVARTPKPQLLTTRPSFSPTANIHFPSSIHLEMGCVAHRDLAGAFWLLSADSSYAAGVLVERFCCACFCRWVLYSQNVELASGASFGFQDSFAFVLPFSFPPAHPPAPPPASPPIAAELILGIFTDGYPSETRWQLRSRWASSTFLEGGPYNARSTHYNTS
eukprot:6122459-Pleurochrysis_carterae.AAC.1